MKKNIVVSSSNPVKLDAVRRGFSRVYPRDELSIESQNVASGVSAQPLTDLETLTGAMNRVEAACRIKPDAEYWVGIEGGISTIENDLAAFAWVVVRSNTLWGKARTGTFFLPPPVAELVRQGKELGEADDIVFQRQNSKQANGAIGILTHNAIDRTMLYTEAVVMALVPFINPYLYAPSSGG
jgi:inosine/xanthosine triphosphatase